MNKNICKDNFWNNHLFNNETFPRFTECFQYSILFIPSLLFVISFVPWIILGRFKHLRRIVKVSFDHWYIIKLLMSVFSVVLLSLEIVLEKLFLKRHDSLDQTYILSYAGLCVSLILVCVLTEIRRRMMNPISSILFTFWLSSSLTYLVRFYSNVCRRDLTDDLNISTWIICLSGVIMCLFLFSFVTDCFPRFKMINSCIKKKVPCPEEYAPILSKLTYFWLDKYIYRWYKNEMTEETIFELRKDEEATKNTDIVENVFLKKLKERKLKIGLQKTDIEISSTNNLISEEDTILKDSTRTLNPGWILFSSLFKVYFHSLIIAWIFKVMHDFFQFAMPFFLKVLLQQVKKADNLAWQGYAIAVVFLITGILTSLTENFCFFLTSNLSIRIRAALIGMIYRKSLRLSCEVRNKFTSGEIMNLMSVDAERIMQWVVYSWFIISSPLQIIIALTFLYSELGYSAFAGLGVIVACFPINGILMKLTQKFSELELSWKDKRVKMLTEIFNGIKVLKMYAWELSFKKKVTKLRDQEVNYILKGSIGWGAISVIWDLIPFFVMLVTFIVYVYSNPTNIITAEKAFVSLVLFNLMKFPMIILPWGFTESVNAFVSVRRIGRYLVGEEIDMTGIYHLEDNDEDKNSKDHVLTITDGCFSWKKDDKMILKDINVEISRGKFIAIVGKVGAGKSSLLSAVLGEMIKDSGIVKVKGKISYVSQEAWIQNKSLKKNVLFTKSYDKLFYDKVIEACGLIPDLEQLPGKDETEIGERGINLSGGQKQRVSLARAVYQNHDVYLLDDPMSAVDAHVGQHIFEKVLSNQGILGTKTRILVTHGLNWLPKVDEVIVLNLNGQISERGTFQELLDNGKEFRDFVYEYMKQNMQMMNLSTESNSEEVIELKSQELITLMSSSPKAVEEFSNITMISPSKSPSITIPQPKSHENLVHSLSQRSNEILSWRAKGLESPSPEILINEPLGYSDSIEDGYPPNNVSPNESKERENVGQLIDDELAMTGNVGWKTYRMYIVTRGIFVFIVTVLMYALFSGLQMYGNIWLEKFSSDQFILNASDMISKNVSYRNVSINIIRERTNYYMIFYGIIGIGQALVMILFWVGFTIGNVRVSRRLHVMLLNGILRSPMSFFDTTPSGRILNRFSKDMDLIDHTVSMNLADVINCFFLLISPIIVIIFVTPWFSLVILPTIILYYFIQLFYMPSSRQARRLDSIATSPVFNNFMETLQGCSVIRAFSEQGTFQKINQTLVDRSSKFKFIQYASSRWLSLRLDSLGNLLVFGAVVFAFVNRDRLSVSLIGLSISYSLQIIDVLNWLLRQYTDLETNAVAIERVREFSMVPSEATWESQVKSTVNWPNRGNITFVNFKLRYRDGLPIVLNNINLQLKGGQKIGVVGRTGAGKSSLNLALLRLVEPAEGSIIIDDVDIMSLGLHDLRRRLTILPQDPVIFCGTLRENLDPFETHTENELNESLERSHLKQWVSSLEEGLDYDCGEGGANLSTGQKQLLCLARAILRKSKVLILDEATASVDVETDRLVMETVRQQFYESTVIIIAHRINTIMDTDKVVVLERGEVVEYGSPKELLNNPQSLFKSLADRSNQKDL